MSFITLREKILAVLFYIIYVSSFSQSRIGIFDDHGDIGTHVKAGSATYIPETGQYVITGAGYNIWGDHDEFHFVWKKMKGENPQG